MQHLDYAMLEMPSRVKPQDKEEGEFNCETDLSLDQSLDSLDIGLEVASDPYM